MTIETTEGHALFRELDSSEMEMVGTFLKSSDYGPNEIIFSEGDAGDSINMIEKGKVRIHKMTGGSSQFCIATLREGDMFGIMSFLDGSSHEATIMSDGQTRLLTLSRTDFESLLNRYPLLASKILRRMALHLAAIVRNMNGQYLGLMHLMFRKGK